MKDLIELLPYSSITIIGGSMTKKNPSGRIIPYWNETTSKGSATYDIYSKLLMERVVFLNGTVASGMSEDIIAQLLLLDNQNSKPISMYIDSPGGSVIAGLKIIDTMNYIKAPVHTIVTGMAASMGFMILSSGEPGHRYALPNAQIMAHMVSSGAGGHIKDMEISLAHSKLLNDKLMKMIAQNVGMDEQKLRKAIDRDLWLQPEEALKFGKKGVIDHVIKSKKGK
jgi:ATP-dependent Clp protease protease subunit